MQHLWHWVNYKAQALHMQQLGHWLNYNAPALQTLAACIALLFFLFTVIVLLITHRATKIQAVAAKMQAAAAESMTAAASKQTAFSEQLVKAAKRQLEESVRPMLFVPATISALPTLTNLYIENLGNGPALEIRYAYARFGEKLIMENLVVPGTIIKGGSFSFMIDSDLARSKGLIFLYRSLSGTDCASELTGEPPHFRYYPDARDWVNALRARQGRSIT